MEAMGAVIALSKVVEKLFLALEQQNSHGYGDQALEEKTTTAKPKITRSPHSLQPKPYQSEDEGATQLVAALRRCKRKNLQVALDKLWENAQQAAERQPQQEGGKDGQRDFNLKEATVTTNSAEQNSWQMQRKQRLRQQHAARKFKNNNDAQQQQEVQNVSRTPCKNGQWCKFHANGACKFNHSAHDSCSNIQPPPEPRSDDDKRQKPSRWETAEVLAEETAKRWRVKQQSQVNVKTPGSHNGSEVSSQDESSDEEDASSNNRFHAELVAEASSSRKVGESKEDNVTDDLVCLDGKVKDLARQVAIARRNVALEDTANASKELKALELQLKETWDKRAKQQVAARAPVQVQDLR